MDFYISDYVRQNYLPDFGPVKFSGITDDMEIPYGTITFARKDADGQYESFLKADQEKSWDETVAKKLLDDSRAGVIDRSAFFCDEENGRLVDATVYRLTVENPKCCIFRPSVFEAVSGAVNTEYTFEMELLFNMGDDLLLPVRKTCKGEGQFSLNFADHLKDILSELDGDPAETLKDFLEDVPNASFEAEENILRVIVSGPESGIQDVEYELGDRSFANISCSEFVRGLCSVRIIDFNETIVEPKEK